MARAARCSPRRAILFGCYLIGIGSVMGAWDEVSVGLVYVVVRE